MTAPTDTCVMAFLGQPVSKAKSPALLNHIFRKCGINATMVPLRVEAENVADVSHALLSTGNVTGIILTNPLKGVSLKSVEKADAALKCSGGVNAMRRGANGVLEGAMFDGAGAVRALEHAGVPLASCRVLLIGTGQAGRAVGTALACHGVRAITMVDADPSKASQFRDELSKLCSVPVEVSSEAAGQYDLVINATSLGANEDDPLPFQVPLGAGKPFAVLDVVVRHPNTHLAAECERNGIKCIAGEEMLLQQIPLFLSYFGFPDAARVALEQMDELRGLLNAT